MLSRTQSLGHIVRFGCSEQMLDQKELVNQMVSRIREAVDPDKIVLFGSRARGTARPDSDFDLLVIKQSDQPRYKRSAPLYTKLADLPAEVEITVYTPEEVADWSNVPQALVTTALREGIAVYERAA